MKNQMTYDELKEHALFIQELLDDALEIMLKIKIKVMKIKKELQNHKMVIESTDDKNKKRQKANEKIWEILEYDELFAE